MSKILLIFMFLISTLNVSVYAEEKKCKVYDIICKSKAAIENTKEYQKKEWKKASDKIKKK